MPTPYDSSPTQLIGRSEAILGIEREIHSAAQCDAKVLITGETGVGKEVVARLIHRRSRRAAAGFAALNCGGLPESLLESELFGHARGSFTGAYRDRPGLLESVPGGTLFLDEVGEMSPRMQALLLRFLESGEIRRVGGDRVQTRADVRLITATNRDLQSHILAGGFRADVYFRLNVVRICMPALRQRREDIPLLVAHFLDASSQAHRMQRPEISAAALEVMVDYEWPGNIRELKNVIERLVLMTHGRAIRPSDLPIDRRVDAPPDSLPGAAHQEERAAELVAQMDRGESFWSAVHDRFMVRDLTREDVRAVIRLGLHRSHGSYRVLVQRFNMPATDYKRFLRFLHVHACHVSFQPFRRNNNGQLDASHHHRHRDDPATRR